MRGNVVPKEVLATYPHRLLDASHSISGNPPAWGCSLCDWRFAKEQSDHLSALAPLEQARTAHRDHCCPGIKKVKQSLRTLLEVR